MRTIRLKHHDGDITVITLIYIFEKFLKQHREMWDSKGSYLNRYYKGVLTKTLKACDKFIEKYKHKVNFLVLKDIENILEITFLTQVYEEKGNDLDILKSGLYSIILFDTAKKHKKKVIGVVLKSFLKDIEKSFEEYREMYIKEIDDVMV